MENVKYRICYWYHEYQDMSASVPTCDYYRKYGECPCEPECEHFITKREVDDIVRNMGKTGQMSDLISREDAIKAVCGDCLREYEEDKCEHENECSMKRALVELPSAEAEWIPCSERLPSESGNYLITVADLRLGHNGEHIVTMADFYAKAKKWNSVVDVLAWKPKPKPYQESEVGE